MMDIERKTELCPTGKTLWEDEYNVRKYWLHITKCRECQKELGLDNETADILKEFYELCPEGNILWENSCNNYTDETYKKYIDHLIECKDCQEGLDIDEFHLDLLKNPGQLEKLEDNDKN